MIITHSQWDFFTFKKYQLAIIKKSISLNKNRYDMEHVKGVVRVLVSRFKRFLI